MNLEHLTSALPCASLRTGADGGAREGRLRRSSCLCAALPSSLPPRWPRWRANALKSTGPRTARGKAWSSLNGLRHGWDARDLRAKLERTGDKEALLLFDWIFTRFFELCSMDAPRCWSYHLRLAARVWCHITGRILLPRVRKSERKGWSVLEGVYRYGGYVVCPRDLKVLNYRDVGIRFINPYPCRRKHVKFSWIPRVEYLDPPPRLPRARRVRQCKGRPDVAPGPVAHAPLGAGDTLGRVHEGSKDVVGPKLEYLLDSTNPSTNSRTATRPTGRWARLAQLVARVWASAGLADWERTLGSERADGSVRSRPDSRLKDQKMWSVGSWNVLWIQQILPQTHGAPIGLPAYPLSWRPNWLNSPPSFLFSRDCQIWKRNWRLRFQARKIRRIANLRTRGSIPARLAGTTKRAAVQVRNFFVACEDSWRVSASHLPPPLKPVRLP